MSDVAYSTNDEEFVHREREDALQALANDGRLVEGEIYWEIDVEEVGLAEYISSARVLEFAAEQIYDDVGEAAEDAFIAPQTAHDELDTFIAAWCEKYFGGEVYWRCKGRSRELKVTAEDIAGFAGDQA